MHYAKNERMAKKPIIIPRTKGKSAQQLIKLLIKLPSYYICIYICITMK